MPDSAILVLNAGSSSLKFALFSAGGGRDFDLVMRGQVSGIGSAPRFRTWAATTGGAGETVAVDASRLDSHRGAIGLALDWIADHAPGVPLAGVGHRVVHGGPERDAPARVTAGLVDEIERLSPLAPHHQPHNLAAIRAVQAAAPAMPQVACFDTAFHATQPDVARRLPLPAELRARGLQRYGFHGLSYEYIATALPDHNAGELPPRLVVGHLGNGASLCAIRDGRSIACSMGFSTLDGLLMGTRCGAVDPGVLLHLMRSEGMDEAALSDLLYNRSGLLGVSGLSPDMQVLLNSPEPAAAEAVELFCYTLVRAIGSMAAALGGIDGLVFTGGIGEHAAVVRARVCHELGWLGLAFDPAANEAGATLLTRPDSAVRAWVVPTNEELVIARHTLRLVNG